MEKSGKHQSQFHFWMQTRPRCKTLSKRLSSRRTQTAPKRCQVPQAPILLPCRGLLEIYCQPVRFPAAHKLQGTRFMCGGLCHQTSGSLRLALTILLAFLMSSLICTFIWASFSLPRFSVTSGFFVTYSFAFSSYHSEANRVTSSTNRT